MTAYIWASHDFDTLLGQDIQDTYLQSVCLGDKPLKTHNQQFFFQLNTCSHSPYVTTSLTRGWVCHLQLLLALANAVILRSKPHGTHDHILLSQIQDSPNLEGQVPIFITPRNRVTQLYPPSHWDPFSFLPRLAGLWRYSTLPPHGLIIYSLGTENTTSNSSSTVPRACCLVMALVLCMLWSCCLTTGMFAELFPSNGCLCWLHSSCFDQICHNCFIYRLI
jgi:hypothetical protein